MKVGWECLLSGVFLICFSETYLKGTFFPSVKEKSDKSDNKSSQFQEFDFLCIPAAVKIKDGSTFLTECFIWNYPAFFCHVSPPWWWIPPVGYQVPPKPLCHCPPWLAGEKKFNKKLRGAEKGRERSLTSYQHRQVTDTLQ